MKAVVDTYDGTVDLYIVDDEDPIAAAYDGAFPDLFSPLDEMPTEMRDHLRYPEDLFRVQTNVWGRYHIDGAQNFYEQAGGWVVAQDPGTGTTGGAITQTTNAETGEVEATRERRIDPQYLLMRLPDEEQEDFLILRSFVPNAGDTERRELTAFMVAKSDPDNYGEIEVFEMQSSDIAGPAIVGLQHPERRADRQRDHPARPAGLPGGAGQPAADPGRAVDPLHPPALHPVRERHRRCRCCAR